MIRKGINKLFANSERVNHTIHLHVIDSKGTVIMSHFLLDREDLIKTCPSQLALYQAILKGSDGIKYYVCSYDDNIIYRFRDYWKLSNKELTKELAYIKKQYKGYIDGDDNYRVRLIKLIKNIRSCMKDNNYGYFGPVMHDGERDEDKEGDYFIL